MAEPRWYLTTHNLWRLRNKHHPEGRLQSSGCEPEATPPFNSQMPNGLSCVKEEETATYLGIFHMILSLRCLVQRLAFTTLQLTAQHYCANGHLQHSSLGLSKQPERDPPTSLHLKKVRSRARQTWLCSRTFS